MKKKKTIANVEGHKISYKESYRYLLVSTEICIDCFELKKLKIKDAIIII